MSDGGKPYEVNGFSPASSCCVLSFRSTALISSLNGSTSCGSPSRSYTDSALERRIHEKSVVVCDSMLVRGETTAMLSASFSRRSLLRRRKKNQTKTRAHATNMPPTTPPAIAIPLTEVPLDEGEVLPLLRKVFSINKMPEQPRKYPR